jgi:ABC-2 type transport system permease protein
MSTLIALALKDLRVLSRDRMALFWALGFPLLFALFFGSIMKAGAELDAPRVQVVLVAQAEGAHVAPLARALQDAGLEVRVLSLAAAERAVQTGDAALLIDVPAPERFAAVELGIDPARRAEASYAAAVLRAVLAQALSKSPVSIPPLQTRLIAGTGEAPSSGFALVFPSMIVWGLIGCAAAFSVALVSERVSGTLLRLYAAPLGRGVLIGGKALACALACLASVSLLSTVGVLGLDVPIASFGKYVAAVLASVACFVGITQALSVLGRTEQAVAGAGWSTLIVLAMCGGAMVPVSLMPAWLVTASALSPVRWSVVALEGALWRGLPWAELAAPLFALCGVGLACFALGALLLRVREA